MVVSPDGRLDIPPIVADWLGLSRLPRFLVELSSEGDGLSADDAALLVQSIEGTRRSGREFSMGVRVPGSDRALLIRGQRAPARFRRRAA